MEFYLSGFLVLLLSPSFNSQRDGILQNTSTYSNASTTVSIPNGMEFYSKETLKSFEPELSFNSQRDGILPARLFSSSLTIEVSIPNGMEFYSSLSSSSFFCARFNSQRDGILPNYTPLSYGARRFQFPTGWNSTYQATASKTITFVSIPNGMEFYAKSTTAA